MRNRVFVKLLGGAVLGGVVGGAIGYYGSTHGG